MSSLNISAMRNYLSASVSSVNRNKINGMLAEVEFRAYLKALGFGSRVSVGGWIARSDGPGNFGRHAVVFFPHTVNQNERYPVGAQPIRPDSGLHTICATFHQIGIHSYFLAPSIGEINNPASVSWRAKQLGVPEDQPWLEFPRGFDAFRRRDRNYNFLRYKTDVADLPDISIEEEFSKENCRVQFQKDLLCEISDVDGIFWGSRYTYPIEIKEKTAAEDRKLGYYFGLDLGPFVKLAFFAAKRGNLHSLFVVREIDNTQDRNLVGWWFIRFDDLAQYASWINVSGGTNMLGGGSTTVKIPKDQFRALDAEALKSL